MEHRRAVRFPLVADAANEPGDGGLFIRRDRRGIRLHPCEQHIAVPHAAQCIGQRLRLPWRSGQIPYPDSRRRMPPPPPAAAARRHACRAVPPGLTPARVPASCVITASSRSVSTRAAASRKAVLRAEMRITLAHPLSLHMATGEFESPRRFNRLRSRCQVEKPYSPRIAASRVPSRMPPRATVAAVRPQVWASARTMIAPAAIRPTRATSNSTFGASSRRGRIGASPARHRARRHRA